MSTTYTPQNPSAYTVTLPSDGDDATGASIDVPMRQLADLTNLSRIAQEVQGALNVTGAPVNPFGTAATAFDVDYAYEVSGVGLFATLCIVGGGGHIAVSVDAGRTWTSKTAAASYASNFYRVLYNATVGTWIAVGDSGEVQTSPTGNTWTHQAVAGSYAGTWKGLAYGAGLFVVAGGISGSDAAIQTSATGSGWTSRTVPFGFLKIHGLTFGGGKFILCGEGTGGAPKVAWSSDGITWTTGALGVSPAAAPLWDACYSAFFGKWFVVGQKQIESSVDGNTWTTVWDNSAGTAMNAFSIMAMDNTVHAVSDARVFTTANGVTWFVAPPPNSSARAKFMRIADTTNPLYVGNVKSVWWLYTSAGYQQSEWWI